jgi:hypothetical protein
MRALAIEIAICVLGVGRHRRHVFFLPLLFIPPGLFSFGQKRSGDRL